MIIDYDITRSNTSLTKIFYKVFFLSHGNYFIHTRTEKLLDLQKLKNEIQTVKSAYYCLYGKLVYVIDNRILFLQFLKFKHFPVQLHIKWLPWLK